MTFGAVPFVLDLDVGVTRRTHGLRFFDVCPNLGPFYRISGLLPAHSHVFEKRETLGTRAASRILPNLLLTSFIYENP